MHPRGRCLSGQQERAHSVAVGLMYMVDREWRSRRCLCSARMRECSMDELLRFVAEGCVCGK